jgi:ABC-type transporter Mla subunit MlaD
MKRTVAIAGVWMVLAISPLFAQSKKDPLTEQQIEDVREAGDQPLQRIKLFVGYVEERANAIHSLTTEAGAQNRTARMHNLLDEFTRLSDDLEDNMDNFNDQHADLRKVLKEIVDKSGQWGTVLNQPPPSSQYDFARKSALESNQSVHDAAVQMIGDQEKYFAEKKKEQKAAEKAAEKSETR